MEEYDLRGMRTKENRRFQNYWNYLQEEAAKRGKIYFCDSGEGKDFESTEQDMEGEDLSGWLIDFDKADEFEKEFYTYTVDDKWYDDYYFAEWKMVDGKVKVNFVQYDG